MLKLEDTNRSAIDAAISTLAKDVTDELAGQGVSPSAIRLRTLFHLRYDGTDTTLPVEFTGETYSSLVAAFTTTHNERFGFTYENRTIILETIAVEATDQRAGNFAEAEAPAIGTEPFTSAQTAPIFTGGQWLDATIALRADLKPGHRLNGPALVIEPHQTIVVEPEWSLEVTVRDHILLRRATARTNAHAIGTNADPVMLEVFNNLFMSIAEQMGFTLQNTASSVNIKERLDFSCAVFDRTGALVANAPHMPVHLGSMDRSVETIIRLNEGRMRPGDVFALNAPYNGGTHLPDITVVTPVFDDAAKTILFYVAARGHHADIGGIAPGSMTPLATTVQEEGVLIDNFHLVDGGRFREAELIEILTNHQYPVRNAAQNIADLKAQVAANAKGVQELRKMVAHFGLATVEAYMGHVQDNAAESVRRVLDRLPEESACDYPTDTGQIIKVRITVDRKNAKPPSISPAHHRCKKTTSTPPSR